MPSLTPVYHVLAEREATVVAAHRQRSAPLHPCLPRCQRRANRKGTAGKQVKGRGCESRSREENVVQPGYGKGMVLEAEPGLVPRRIAMLVKRGLFPILSSSRMASLCPGIHSSTQQLFTKHLLGTSYPNGHRGYGSDQSKPSSKEQQF